MKLKSLITESLVNSELLKYATEYSEKGRVIPPDNSKLERYLQDITSTVKSKHSSDINKIVNKFKEYTRSWTHDYRDETMASGDVYGTKVVIQDHRARYYDNRANNVSVRLEISIPLAVTKWNKRNAKKFGIQSSEKEGIRLIKDAVKGGPIMYLEANNRFHEGPLSDFMSDSFWKNWKINI